MSWPGAILTDSGGFQVFSLCDLRKVTDDGVIFRSHLDGSEHSLTPEKSIEIQQALGSDIAMVLDECIEYPADHERAAAAVRRTTEWARRCRDYAAALFHRRNRMPKRNHARQVLFAIVQGGTHAICAGTARASLWTWISQATRSEGGRRRTSRAFVRDGCYGRRRAPRRSSSIRDGVAFPEQLADYVASGIDMMDCVLPTRMPQRMFVHQRGRDQHQERHLRR